MKNITRKLILILVFVLTVSLFPKVTRAESYFDVEPYYELAMKANGDSAFHFNKILASPEFEGRQAGAIGNDNAATWIANEFQKMGLHPFNKNSNSFFQPLSVPYNDVLFPLTFRIKKGDEWIIPNYRDDYIVFPYSGSGKASSKFVFVGYGITDLGEGYDDYANIDVLNRTVVMFYQKPTFLTENQEEFGSLERIKNAKEHKASAVIFIQKSNSFPIFDFKMKMATGRTADLPALLVNKSFSEEMIQLNYESMEDLEDKIDKNEKPFSFVFKAEIDFEVNIVDEKRQSNNVIGYIPAIDQSITDSIVIGAHYDHLGMDYIKKTYYAGANDNASGTATVLEVARNLATHFCLPKVNLVFIAFTGEEEGLYGSEYYVENPLFPIKNIKAMINLDMVGTGTGDLLAGTSSIRYPELCDLINTCAEYLEQSIPIDSNLLYPGSDHYYFHFKKVPSVFFYKTNPSNIGGYHTLADTIDSIDPLNLEKCSQLVSLMVLTFSEVSFISFDTFPTEKEFANPYFFWDGYATNFLNNELVISIKDSPIKIKYDDTFQVFYPLNKGSNHVIFQVKFNNVLIREFDFVVFSIGENFLRADFNKDQKVNVVDLALLSRNFQKKAMLYQPLSLYDLNSDEIINQDDFALFEDLFKQANSLKP
jgi:aminopeptidase YwaD